MSRIDFLVVGQGLAGSVLSLNLLRRGYKIAVIDQRNPESSSQVAAGLFNPITGRRVVKSWMADALLPAAATFYQDFENESGARFYFPVDVLEVLQNIKDVNEWSSRSSDSEIQKYLASSAPEEIYRDKIHEFKKMFRINSSGWMNIPLFIDGCSDRLRNTKSIIEKKFDYSALRIQSQSIRYENMESTFIIFCEGISALNNPLWEWLPFVPAKGEILTIECDLPQDYILLRGIFFIPLGNKLFRVGSTYEWNYENDLPTEAGKQKLIDLIDKLLKIPYRVVDHRAGIRPTVKDRRPIIGRHPDHENTFIFNGLGTKGTQLAPFFADHLIDHLEGKAELMPEVDVSRFSK